MTNVLSRLSAPQERRQPSSEADLERAIDHAGDARDLAKDVLRSLPDAECSDADTTARFDVPPRFVVENHIHQDSKPDSDPPAKKQVTAGLIAIGSGIGITLLGGLATLLQRCGH